MEQSSQKQLQVTFKDGAFDLHEADKPTPGPGQALIRVHYSAVNPFDRFMYSTIKQEGAVLGNDGCGIVESVGEGVDSSWIGKKVSFLGQSWQRWASKDVNQLVVFNESFDLKNGATAFVNPFTVSAMYDYAVKQQAKGVVILAASSQLAKMMVRLCHSKGAIETISIVRKADQIRDLKENYGAIHVLDQTSPTFLQELEAAVKIVQPTVLYDCVGGDLPGDVFAKMPAKSHMLVYGNLTKQRITIESREFYWSDKHISGLVLFRWLAQLSKEDKDNWFKFVAEDLEQGGKIFGSKIIKEMSLREFKEAISESEKEASNGKYQINIIDA